MACADAATIGANCNTSSAACDVLKPCLNSGICTNVKTNPHGYLCSCRPGFNGTHCELDYRPCKLDTCWNKGKKSPIYFLCSTRLIPCRDLCRNIAQCVSLHMFARLAGSALRNPDELLCQCDMSQRWRLQARLAELYLSMSR